nr:hypothetical protein [uncultured Carboxylicivirga sp.]
MKEKYFFVPINEIADFAETASENALNAVICGTTFNEVVFSVKYNPAKEKLAIIELESSLNKGYWADATDK